MKKLWIAIVVLAVLGAAAFIMFKKPSDPAPIGDVEQDEPALGDDAGELPTDDGEDSLPPSGGDDGSE